MMGIKEDRDGADTGQCPDVGLALVGVDPSQQEPTNNCQE